MLLVILYFCFTSDDHVYKQTYSWTDGRTDSFYILLFFFFVFFFTYLTFLVSIFHSLKKTILPLYLCRPSSFLICLNNGIYHEYSEWTHHTVYLQHNSNLILLIIMPHVDIADWFPSLGNARVWIFTCHPYNRHHSSHLVRRAVIVVLSFCLFICFLIFLFGIWGSSAARKWHRVTLLFILFFLRFVSRAKAVCFQAQVNVRSKLVVLLMLVIFLRDGMECLTSSHGWYSFQQSVTWNGASDLKNIRIRKLHRKLWHLIFSFSFYFRFLCPQCQTFFGAEYF